MGRITVTLANPFSIFAWSLAVLLFGCVIGLHWRTTPGMAFCIAALGAVLMVLHDLGMALLWFTATAKLLAKDRHDRS